jgi:predicted HTH domain antitoxin
MEQICGALSGREPREIGRLALPHRIGYQFHMLLSVEVPDPIAHSLRLDGPQSKRRALEMFALEGYRSGELSRGQISEMLEMEFNETEKFLKDHGAFLQYTADDLEKDAANLREFLS